MSAIGFRQQAVRMLTARIGVYALCDLDRVPIYVGQSIDGIRQRVRRHLTSARSDIIANRQVDVWEVAWVMAWPVAEPIDIGPLESALFHRLNEQSALMNASIPALSPHAPAFRDPDQTVQVMDDDETQRRLQPSVRLPRQIEHYGRLVDHFLNVKDSPELRVPMEAHFQRLARYHARFLEQVGPAPVGSEDAQSG